MKKAFRIYKIVEGPLRDRHQMKAIEDDNAWWQNYRTFEAAEEALLKQMWVEEDDVFTILPIFVNDETKYAD